MGKILTVGREPRIRHQLTAKKAGETLPSVEKKNLFEGERVNWGARLLNRKMRIQASRVNGQLHRLKTFLASKYVERQTPLKREKGRYPGEGMGGTPMKRYQTND